MSQEASKLLKRLAAEGNSSVIRRLRALLETPQARVLPSSEHLAQADDLESIYRVRSEFAKERKRRFVGLSSLVSSLQASAPSRQIEIRSVVGELEKADIFFDAQTKDLIGAVVITMSAHTRAYYRGELTGNPLEARSSARKPARTSTHRAAKEIRVTA